MTGLKNMAALQSLASLALILMMSWQSRGVDAAKAWELTTWTSSHATFYGDMSGAATMGGACGYGNLWYRGYGLNTAALSTTLFNGGLTCGACFELKCQLNGGSSAKWCYRKALPIKITATNFCPPNWARPTNHGGWCNPPRTHFDLPLATFSRMAQPIAGIIPIQYRRVPCVRTGGIKFLMNGNPWFNLVLVYNVAGGGDLKQVQMKAENTPWFPMTQNWGANWELKRKLTGQKVSFIVTLGNGKSITFPCVTPANWWFGQTFESAWNC